MVSNLGVYGAFGQDIVANSKAQAPKKPENKGVMSDVQKLQQELAGKSAKLAQNPGGMTVKEYYDLQRKQVKPQAVETTTFIKVDSPEQIKNAFAEAKNIGGKVIIDTSDIYDMEDFNNKRDGFGDLSADKKGNVKKPAIQKSAAKKPAEAEVPVVTTKKAGDKEITIKKGDVLWNIAKQQLGAHATDNQIANYVQKLAKLNGLNNPDLIKAGNTLKLY